MLIPAVNSGEDSDASSEARAVLPDAQLLSDTEMSSLFRGYDSAHGDVILKILKTAPSDSARWLDSADYTAALGERLLRSGSTTSGRRFFLFRFIRGECLSEVVRPGNVIRGALLDEIAMQLLRQLAALNLVNQDVVHRDITPGNMILDFEDQRAVVRLIDYESACFASEPQIPIRAYGFSAPEQAEGRAVPSSDLFSFVSTLYFLAEGTTAPAVSSEGRTFSPDTFGQFTEFEELFGVRALLQCWHEEQDERPSSAAAFLRKRIQPGTRVMRPPRPIGTFTVGSQTVDLFDQRYQLRV